MSRVTFHTKTAQAEIGGAERHWWAHLCWRLTNGVLDIADPWRNDAFDRLWAMVPAGHHLKAPDSRYDDRTRAGRLLTAIHVGSGRDVVLEHKGHRIDTFGLILNTALAVGSDAVRLAARLHGSCEIHCWVEDNNREWLAGLIEEGVATGVLRKSFPDSNHRGYDEVIKLLRHPEHRGPVVTSYSVSEFWPGVHLLDRQPTDPEELYDIPPGERWDRSMYKQQGAELKPDDWTSFRFGHKLSALDVIAVDWEARLDKAIADRRI